MRTRARPTCGAPRVGASFCAARRLARVATLLKASTPSEGSPRSDAWSPASSSASPTDAPPPWASADRPGVVGRRRRDPHRRSGIRRRRQRRAGVCRGGSGGRLRRLGEVGSVTRAGVRESAPRARSGGGIGSPPHAGDASVSAHASHDARRPVIALARKLHALLSCRLTTKYACAITSLRGVEDARSLRATASAGGERSAHRQRRRAMSSPCGPRRERAPATVASTPARAADVIDVQPRPQRSFGHSRMSAALSAMPAPRRVAPRHAAARAFLSLEIASSARRSSPNAAARIHSSGREPPEPVFLRVAHEHAHAPSSRQWPEG